MKSFFTNLGKALLCGAVVAMIGCTDLHSDIKLVDTNNQEALDDLKAELEANYALKSELETVRKQLADEKAALEAELAALNADLEVELAALKAAQEAGDEAAIAAAQAAVDAAKAELNEALSTAKADFEAALAGLSTDLAGLDARLAALEAACQCEEIAAQLAALDEYVKTMEAGIEGRITTLETSFTALNNLLADLEAKHDQEVVEVYQKIDVVESALSALNNIVTVDVAAQIAALEVLKDYVNELYLADEAMQENLTQLMNATQLQIDDLTTFQNDLYAKVNTLEEFCTTIINNYELADQELLALIMETKDELSRVITNINNYLNDLAGEVEELAARVQSLVFIPEYSDGKATIEWGLLIDNDSAVNFLLNRIVTPGNINAFKNLVKEYIAKVKNVIVNQTEGLEASIDEFLANLVYEDALEGALAEMFEQIQNLAAAEIYKILQDTKINADVNLDVNVEVDVWGIPAPGEGTANGTIEGDFVLPDFDGDLEAEADKIASKIMADIIGAFQLGDFNLTDTVKGLLSSMKAVGVKTARELIDLLQSVSVGDILGQLNNAEFKSLLSKMFSVAKKLEAKILENTAVMTKESVIRYKVQAQNAAAVAANIAANWKDVLSYDVEAVDVRAAAPGLEITNVVAKGDELHVTVLPQNFNYRFYLTYVLEDSFLYGAAEQFFDKFGKTGLISYSAALVLNDGNNIRSTEYVNFVSGANPEIFTPEVIKNGAVVETEAITLVKGQDETVTLCEDMYMGYLSVPNRKILTKAALESKGYHGISEKTVVATNNMGVAGPCTFNGLVGEIDDYDTDWSYTFTTYWTVSDIVLAVNSEVEYK